MSHEFALREKNRKKKFFHTKKRNFFLIIFLVLIFILAWMAFQATNYFGFVEKMDPNKEYVYTVKKLKNETQEETYDEVPAINILDDRVKKINQSILDIYEDATSHGEYDYQYEFNRSANILSLKISYAYYLNDDASEITRFFHTYNIDLKTGKFISDVELLNMFGVTPKRLNEFLAIKFQSYYNELVNYGYYTSKSCDYECFLKNRGITSNYTDDIYLYVDHGSLVLFKFYYKVSKYAEESYFIDDSYQIMVKRK